MLYISSMGVLFKTKNLGGVGVNKVLPLFLSLKLLLISLKKSAMRQMRHPIKIGVFG